MLQVGYAYMQSPMSTRTKSDVGIVTINPGDSCGTKGARPAEVCVSKRVQESFNKVGHQKEQLAILLVISMLESEQV